MALHRQCRDDRLGRGGTPRRRPDRSARRARARALAARSVGRKSARSGAVPVRIGVIGGGAWGTALAQVAAAGGPVLLWAFEPDVVDAINADHVNPVFLAGVPLSHGVQATNDLGDLASCEALLVVTPAQHMRRILGAAPVETRPLILCSKGIEADTMALMSEAAAQTCPDAPIAILSG